MSLQTKLVPRGCDFKSSKNDAGELAAGLAKPRQNEPFFAPTRPKESTAGATAVLAQKDQKEVSRFCSLAVGNLSTVGLRLPF